MLTRVAILKVVPIIRKLHRFPTGNHLPAVFTFTKSAKIAQVAVTVRTGRICREFLYLVYLQHVIGVASPVPLDMSFPQLDVIGTLKLAIASIDWGKITNRLTKRHSWLKTSLDGLANRSMSRLDVSGSDKERQLAPSSNEKLSDPLLRHTKTPSFGLIGNDPIAKLTSLHLHPGEKLSSGCRAQTGDIFHNEGLGLIVLNVSKELSIKTPSGVINQSFTVVGTIYLTSLRKPLAGRPSDDQIHPPITEQLVKVLRMKLGQITDKGVRYARMVHLEGLNGGLIKVDGRQAFQTSRLQP